GNAAGSNARRAYARAPGSDSGMRGSIPKLGVRESLAQERPRRGDRGRAAGADDLDDLVRSHAAALEDSGQSGVDAGQQRGDRELERPPRGLVIDVHGSAMEA